MAALILFVLFLFFNDTATTEIYTLSLHDALPIWFSKGTGCHCCCRTSLSIARTDQACGSRISTCILGTERNSVRTISRSRRPRRRESSHHGGTSRGSKTTRTSTRRKGSRAFSIWRWTTEEPSQRRVVFSPTSGKPLCSHSRKRWPLRTFRCVPSANHPTMAMTTTTKMDSSGDIGFAAESKDRRPLWHTLSPRKSADMRVITMPAARSWLDNVREFFYGMISLDFEQQAREQRGELESAFMLLTLGDMLGVPVMPPLYALRILPYAVPMISAWKRRVGRERDLSEREEFHLHGV